jgi:hypothetical protein
MDTANVINRERRSKGVVMAGSLAEGIAGIAAVVLAIVGLANISPLLVLSIATIAVGAALLFEGGAVTARFSNLVAATGSQVNATEFGVGMTAELLGGLVGVVLGVLALVGINPLTLIAVAAIVYGASFLLGSGSTAHINSSWAGVSEQREFFRDVTREAISAASGVQFLIGVGVITLGILALIGIAPLVLSLVAMLSAGFSDLLNGTAIMGRISGITRRHAT